VVGLHILRPPLEADVALPGDMDGLRAVRESKVYLQGGVVTVTWIKDRGWRLQRLVCALLGHAWVAVLDSKGVESQACKRCLLPKEEK